MLPKTGLIIVSNPKQISKILSSVKNCVKNTVYIQLLSALTDPLGSFHKNRSNAWPKYSQTIYGIYAQAARYCNDLDVHVLLSGLKYNIPKIQTRKPIDVVIFDKSYTNDEIDNFIKSRVTNTTNDYEVVTVDTGAFEDFTVDDKDEKIFNHAVLGGTFDRLHIAHKLLLSEAALHAKHKVTVGVTEENMLQAKILWELVQDIDVRVQNVKDFLYEICPELEYDVVKIADPFGPAIVDPTMEVIVVSEETLKGGQKINEIRKEKGLNPLEMVLIELIDEPNPNPIEETKISSSTIRMRLLGTLLRPIVANTSIQKKPYIIGLTGGIASGKSGVAKHLEEFDVLVINCDKIGHDVYKPGTNCYKSVVEYFGDRILKNNGEIDRSVLGPIVFKNPRELNKLNSLVWPAIVEEVNNIIHSTTNKVVVIEAAVLLMAGWQKYCHEVWTTIVPKEEAIKRLVTRNHLPEDEAERRIASQPPNKEYVRNAHVVFCTLWPVEYTKIQVLRAWNLLQNRILLD